MRSLMTLAAALVLAIALTGRPALAQDATDQTATTQAAIAQVIQAQLAAFQVDDGTLAFSYASPGIRAQFGTADRFMTMVRTAYQPVYRPAGVEFLELVATPRGPMQRVLFVGQDGVAVVAEYFMQRQGDGTWRISGVRLTRSDDGVV